MEAISYIKEETYYEELVHAVMKAEKSYNLLPASWRSGEVWWYIF